MTLRPSKNAAKGPVLVRRQAGKAWQIPLATREIETVLAAMRGACGITSGVELTLTDDAAMAEVNEAFLGCAGPTNILSFPADPATHGKTGGPDSATACLLLSLDTLERECLLYGQGATEHALRLLAHGMAHLAGFDHGKDMEHMEKVALAAAEAALRQG